MSTRVVIGIAVVVLVVAIVAFGPGLATAYARNQKLAECERLKAELASASAQGTDIVRMQDLQARIAACSQEAESYGADIDLGSVALTTCDAMAEKMEREFIHYRSTSYDDPVKRNNTRTAILRFGEELARCYSDAIAKAESTTTTTKIRKSMLRSIAAATARRDCYLYDQTGCGRFALNEDHGNDKAAAEDARVIGPLNNVLTNELEPRAAALAARERTTSLSTAAGRLAGSRALTGALSA